MTILVEINDTKEQLNLAEKQKIIKIEELKLQQQIYDKYVQLSKAGATSYKVSNLENQKLLHLQSEEINQEQYLENLNIRIKNLTSKASVLKNEIDKYNYSIGQCTVRAPIAGYITNMHLNKGDHIKRGQELFSIIDTSKWFVISDIKESNLRFIKVGDTVKFTTSATGFKFFKGKIVVIENGISRPQYEKFSSLYNIPRNLDWVRLDYRFPVIIEVTSEPSPDFKIGVDAHVWI